MRILDRNQGGRVRLVKFVVAFVFACSSGTAYAQEVSKGDVEVMGFVGGVTDGGGATFGGGVHYAFSPACCWRLKQAT